jgi:hypothetical protein
MSFIIVCIDKEEPGKSEIVPVEETEEQLKADIPADLDAMLFPTKQNAEKWVAADEREFPGTYDYHIIQVG